MRFSSSPASTSLRSSPKRRAKIRLADAVEILIYQLVGQCKAADDSAAVACDYDLVHDLALADGEHRILKLLDKLPVCKKQ